MINDHVRVTFQETLIDHGDIAITLQRQVDEPSLGSPSIEEHLSCSSSSSCTQSSQDIDEDQARFMASLKAIGWASGSSTV